MAWEPYESFTENLTTEGGTVFDWVRVSIVYDGEAEFENDYNPADHPKSKTYKGISKTASGTWFAAQISILGTEFDGNYESNSKTIRLQDLNPFTNSEGDVLELRSEVDSSWTVDAIKNTYFSFPYANRQQATIPLTNYFNYTLATGQYIRALSTGKLELYTGVRGSFSVLSSEKLTYPYDISDSPLYVYNDRHNSYGAGELTDYDYNCYALVKATAEPMIVNIYKEHMVAYYTDGHKDILRTEKLVYSFGENTYTKYVDISIQPCCRLIMRNGKTYIGEWYGNGYRNFQKQG